VSSGFPRKGLDALFAAYGQAFTNRDDVSLIVKTFPNPHNEVQAWLDQARSSNAHYPDVVLIDEDLKEPQLKALFAQSHALVAPSRAEGFGFPLAEAMLSELPVITTAWGGQRDFCNPQTAWLVDYEFAYAKTHLQLADSVWANPKINDLAHVMQTVWRASAAEKAARTQLAKSQLQKQFTWAQVALRTETAVRQWSHQAPQAPCKIAWVSTWNTRCGIASYSDHLVEHLTVPVQIFAPYSRTLEQADQDWVTRCWHDGARDGLAYLTTKILASDCNVVMVQFNYGFYGLESLAQCLQNLHRAGKVVVITLHSTVDPVEPAHKTLSRLVDAFKLCDRILVHSVADLNRLKNLGLIENVTLFAHGILDVHQSQVTSNAKTVFKKGQWIENPKEKMVQCDLSTSVPSAQARCIASYGFFLPHKGLLELIDAFALLIKSDPHLRLHMINAQYPAKVSESLIAAAREKIAQLGLQECIDLCTDYLSDAQSIAYLSQADLVVFPYQQTGESASGAVRQAISANVPVVVTPLPIFDDVASAVHVLPGTSVSAIAQGLECLLRDMQNGEARFEAVQASAATWRGEHYYSVLGLRLSSMMQGLARDLERSQEKMG
jgi:glycosyltransferase involved in cell wall biosynthesis